MARPKKLEGERRTERFNLRFTVAEKLHVEEQAAKAGLDPTEFLRRRALSLPIAPAPAKADAALIAELNRIGVNVNQLARAMHSGRTLPGGWPEIAPQLQTVLAKVAATYGS